MGCLLPAVAKEPVASKAACRWLKLAILAAFTLDEKKQTSSKWNISYQSKDQFFYVPLVAPVTRRESTDGCKRSVRNPGISSEPQSTKLTFFFLALQFFNCQMPPSFTFAACHT